MIEIHIGPNEQNQRLDRFLKKYLPQAPLSYIYKMIRKDVKVNKKRVSEETVLHEGDLVLLYISDELFENYTKHTKKTGAKRQFAIVYEDENILIVNKPKGLLTHGDKTEKKNTLVNQVVDYLIEKGEYVPAKEKTFMPAASGRLDRNTSGMIIFGKNYPCVQALNKMIRERTSIRKFYLAGCFGQIKEELHLLDSAQKDEVKNRVKIDNDAASGVLEMETIVRPLALKNNVSLVEVEIITGRTHQIRVHLASIGNPIIGDAKYGDRKRNKKVLESLGLDSQFLHAHKLIFDQCESPLSYLDGKEFLCPLPKGLQSCWEQL